MFEVAVIRIKHMKNTYTFSTVVHNSLSNDFSFNTFLYCVIQIGSTSFYVYTKPVLHTISFIARFHSGYVLSITYLTYLCYCTGVSIYETKR